MQKTEEKEYAAKQEEKEEEENEEKKEEDKKVVEEEIPNADRREGTPLLREQCRVGTGPSNVKETWGASITSSNPTSPPLSEAAAQPAISCMISSRSSIGRGVRARLPPSSLNKTCCEKRD